MREIVRVSTPRYLHPRVYQSRPPQRSGRDSTLTCLLLTGSSADRPMRMFHRTHHERSLTDGYRVTKLVLPSGPSHCLRRDINHTLTRKQANYLGRAWPRWFWGVCSIENLLEGMI